MNLNNNLTNTAESAKLFQKLIEQETDIDSLRKDLLEMYFNYSRQLKHHYETSQGICPLGETDSQLFSLLQIIAVLDAGKKYPLVSELRATAA